MSGDSKLSNEQDPSTESVEGPILGPSDRHRLLASYGRRVTLATLGDQTFPVSVEELADAISDRNSDVEVARLIVSLHHKHLPMLDAMGVVEYDSSANEVTDFTQIPSSVVR